jgi:hypothetical protein
MSHISMFCPSCDCECLILPFSCLFDRQSRLKKLHVEDYPEILNAVNNFILIGTTEEDGILGERCFNELCSAISQAESQAQEYRKATPNASGEQAEFWFYMPDNWLKLLKNSYFQNMYATYCLYYYYNLQISSSETSRDGDVKHNRTGVNNSGEASSNIDQDESKTKAAVHLGHARRYSSMFKLNFIEKYYSLFKCLKRYCGKCKENYCNCGSCSDSLSSSAPYDNHVKKPKRPRSTFL